MCCVCKFVCFLSVIEGANLIQKRDCDFTAAESLLRLLKIACMHMGGGTHGCGALRGQR